MKKLIVTTTNFALFLLMLQTFLCPVSGTEAKALNIGPALDEKEIKIIPDYSVRLLAFEMGEIDMVTVLPKDLERVTRNRPDAQIIYTRPVYLTMGHLSFNVRETVNGEWNPWSIKELRQAMAHLINRDEVIAKSPLEGFAEKATTIVSTRYGDWVNPDPTKVDFEVKYPFSLEKASLLLDKAGFMKGPDGWRRDPRTGDILTLKISVLPESIAPELYWIAMKYKTYAMQIGVQVIVDPQPVSAMVAGVMGRTFQSWLWGYYYGAYPTYYYWNYHSKEDRWVDGKPEGINYFGIRNATLDKYLDGFLYTDNFEEAKRNFWKAQEILTDLVPTIPAYLPIDIIAISGKWKNIPLFYAPPYEKPLDIYDPTNPNLCLFDLNIYDEERPIGGKFVDFTIGFSSLNPLTSILSSESIIMNHIYLPLTVSNPTNIYDIKGRIKLLIEDWDVEPIIFEGKNATKLTVTFRKDFTWHDGVPVTAYDMEWTILEAGVKRRLIWAYPEMVRQMKKITVLDPHRIEIIVEGRSWQYELDLLTFRPVPAHLWSKVPDITIDPSREPHPSRPDLTLMTGNSYWILQKYVPGKNLVLVWNPNYPMRDPRKKLTLDVNAPSSIEVGSVLSLSVTVKDYFNRAVSAATVTAEAKGPITGMVILKHVSQGVYTGVISELPAGNYSLTVTAKLPVPYGIISGTSTLSIRVLLPESITIPGVPENLIPPMVTPYSRPPTPSFNLGIEPLASYIPLAIIALTLILANLLLITRGLRSTRANR